MAEKNYAAAMLDVLRTTMEEDPTFVVMGNEVLGIGPENHQLEPFKDEYPDRVYFPPCAEASFAALAAGAAMCGQKVFAHLGLASFTYPAFSSIANEIASAHMSSGGRIKVPAILHMSHGLLHGGGGQHSETPLGTYWNLPGIEIVAPSGPKEVKGLLRTAINSENPTMVWTHAFGYGAEEDVPDEDYEIPFGVADVKREGSDVTLVACSTMVGMSLEAAEELASEGVEAEVIDLRTLVPLDEEAILESVGKTGRLVVVDEGRRRAGIAAEIAAMVAEKGLDSLKAPIARVARMDYPVASSAAHEAFISPAPDKIVAAAKGAMEGAPAAAAG